jgi:hypothetical protein
MTALTDLAATRDEYEALEAVQAQVEIDATAAHVAVAALAALGPVSGMPTAAQNAAAHTLYLLNMKRGDLRAHRKALINQGYLFASRALLIPGSPGAAAWLPPPSTGGSGFSFYQEAAANGR